LSEYPIFEVGQGVFIIKYTLSDNSFVLDIISEQALIDLAREKEDEE
jgi:hypothetical protein